MTRLSSFSPTTHVRTFAVIALAATLSLASGCTIVTSHEDTRVSGRLVSDENLQRIVPGETTEAWVIAALGEPSQVREVDDSVRLLRYDWTQIKRTDASLLLVFDVGSRVEKEQTVMVECRDGVVVRTWRENRDKSAQRG